MMVVPAPSAIILSRDSPPEADRWEKTAAKPIPVIKTSRAARYLLGNFTSPGMFCPFQRSFAGGKERQGHRSSLPTEVILSVPQCERSSAPQENRAPLRSRPICAKLLTVDAGSATNWKPFCGAGVKGGFVSGVLTVKAMVAEFSTKSPAKLVPLLKDLFFVMPFHSMRSDFRKAFTNPKGCNGFKLSGTVNASNTRQTFSRCRTASPSSTSTSTLPLGISIVHKPNVGETPGSYE